VSVDNVPEDKKVALYIHRIFSLVPMRALALLPSLLIWSFCWPLHHVIGQVTSEANDQPVLNILDIYGCCNYLDLQDTNNNIGNGHSVSVSLTKCVNASSYTGPQKPAVAVVTYVTANILDYAAYSLLLLAAYAQQQNYLFRIYDEHISSIQLEFGDQRWNKVIILHDALQTWARDVEYIIWVDADLIFLDFGMKIDLIAHSYDWADILLSRDPKIDNGIMNSGCIVAKNNPWTIQFLMDWWVAFDRNEVMDQLVFDYLWYSRHGELSQHIALLAPDVINTNFPAWANQKPWNQVLHLAGGSTALRATIFRFGAGELCRVRTLNQEQQVLLPVHRLKRQLGITREFLVEIQQGGTLHTAMQHVLHSINDADRSLNSSSCGKMSIQQRKSTVKKVYGLINDALRVYSEELDYRHGNYRHSDGVETSEATAESNRRTRALYRDEGIIYSMKWVYSSMDAMITELLGIQCGSGTMKNVGDSGEPTCDLLANLPGLLSQLAFLVDLLQDVLDVGFNLAQMQDSSHELPILLADIHGKCEQLTSLASHSTSHSKRVLYYKFKYWEFVAMSHQQFGDSDSVSAEIQALKETYVVFLQMKASSTFGSGNGLKDPYREGANVLERLSILQCQIEDYESCLASVQAGMQLVEDVWSSEKILDCLQNNVSDCKQVRYRNIISFEKHSTNQPTRASDDSISQQHKQTSRLVETVGGPGTSDEIVVEHPEFFSRELHPHPIFDPGSSKVIPVSIAESMMRKLIIAMAACLDLCSAKANDEQSKDNYSKLHTLGAQGQPLESRDDVIMPVVTCFSAYKPQLRLYLRRALAITDYYSVDGTTGAAERHDGVFDAANIFKEKLHLLQNRISHMEKLVDLAQQSGVIERGDSTVHEENFNTVHEDDIILRRLTAERAGGDYITLSGESVADSSAPRHKEGSQLLDTKKIIRRKRRSV
jgi:hypothetical protein